MGKYTGKIIKNIASFDPDYRVKPDERLLSREKEEGSNGTHTPRAYRITIASADVVKAGLIVNKTNEF